MRTDEKRIRTFAKDVVWKYLLDNTENIVQAQKLLQMTDFVLKTACESEVFAYKQKIEKEKVSVIPVPESLKGETYQKERDFLAIFSEEESTVAYDIIRQMNGAIQSLINRELKDRKLDSLPLEFLQ